ncbi:MAG: DeoR family transcriptional regulator [Prevotella sp.]|nr:DeoR family transcriptional regulator [Prevotella sp.]
MTDVGDNVGGNVGGRNATKFTERQKNIFNRLIETGQMNVLENVLDTSASLATHFKVDARTIRRDLSVLQTEGFIRHDGPDKGGRRVDIKG